MIGGQDEIIKYDGEKEFVENSDGQTEIGVKYLVTTLKADDPEYVEFQNKRDSIIESVNKLVEIKFPNDSLNRSRIKENV